MASNRGTPSRIPQGARNAGSNVKGGVIRWFVKEVGLPWVVVLAVIGGVVGWQAAANINQAATTFVGMSVGIFAGDAPDLVKSVKDGFNMAKSETTSTTTNGKGPADTKTGKN